MHGRVGALPLDEPEDRAGRAVDDRERVLVARAEREAARRSVAPLPDEAGRRPLELGQQLPRARAPRGRASRRPPADRPLVGRRVHVRVEDPRVRVVEPRRLDPPLEQRLGLAHEELVERVLARDQHREAVAAAPGPAPLLAQRGDGAGKADRDRAVELRRCRSRARAHRSPRPRAARPPSAAARSRAAAQACSRPGTGASRAAVAVSTRSEVKRWISSAALRLFAKQIVRRPRETSPDISSDASESALARTPSSGSSRAGFQRTTSRSRPGRGVRLDDRRRPAGEREGELAGVRDRGRREQELRLGAVGAGQPPQPPEHVPDVRAEDAAVDVRLVDDDVAQVVEHVAPAVVVREDADVEHVGVREDHVRRLADLRPPLGLGVAVVDRGANPAEAEPGEAPRLVLGQRLRRVEVERPRGRLARDRVEDGQVEGERLPRCGAGRDDDVLAACGRLPRLALLRVEAVDAARGEGGCDARVEAGGERLEAGVARRLGGAEGELLAEEQVVPGARQRVTPRGTARTCARSCSCPAGRSASRAPRRPRTGSRSGRRGRRSATGCRGWRRCRA